MADNQFSSTVEALFKGMDSFVTTKTVVGEAVKIDDAIILPLVDVSCGMGAGSYVQNSKANTGGGIKQRSRRHERKDQSQRRAYYSERSDKVSQCEASGRCDENYRYGS